MNDERLAAIAAALLPARAGVLRLVSGSPAAARRAAALVVSSRPERLAALRDATLLPRPGPAGLAELTAGERIGVRRLAASVVASLGAPPALEPPPPGAALLRRLLLERIAAPR